MGSPWRSKAGLHVGAVRNHDWPIRTARFGCVSPVAGLALLIASLILREESQVRHEFIPHKG